MLAHLHDPPPRASDTPGVPRDFDRVLARALAKAPEDRYPSAGDFGRAALAAAEGRSVTEEERSVARGAAAPTVRRDGASCGPRRADPEPASPQASRRRSDLPRARAAALAVGLGAGARALAAAARRARVRPRRRRRRAAARRRRCRERGRAARATRSPPPTPTRTSARISRLLTSDAQRVSPTDRQTRRDARRRRLRAPVRRATDHELRPQRPRGHGRARRAARPRATAPARPRHDDLERHPRARPAADHADRRRPDS